MFKIIQGLPDQVLGVEARGRVTDADYHETLIPEAEKRLAKYKSLRLLYVAGKDFYGYDTHALWDDTAFGLKHWTSFSGIALVTDIIWLRAMAHAFSPLFPGTVKVFDCSARRAAEKWIAQGISSAEKPKKKPAKRKAVKKKKTAATKKTKKKPAVKKKAPKKTTAKARKKSPTRKKVPATQKKTRKKK